MHVFSAETATSGQKSSRGAGRCLSLMTPPPHPGRPSIVGGRPGMLSSGRCAAAAAPTQRDSLIMNDIAEMLEAARRARDNAHAPYSGFAVGACLASDDG